MFFMQYKKIYYKVTGDSVSVVFSIFTSLIFAVILWITLAYNNGNLVLKVFPLGIFLIYVVASLMDQSGKGSGDILFSLFKITPLKTQNIIFGNYLCKVINRDQLFLSISFLVVLITYKLSIYNILMFFLRILLLLFISQVIEYFYLYYKSKFIYQFILPILLLLACFLASELIQSADGITLMNLQYLDITILILFIVSIFLCFMIVEKLLRINTDYIPFIIIKFSNILSKIICLPLPKLNFKVIVVTLLKSYLRNITILSKYFLLTALTVTYTTIGYFIQNATTKYNLFNIAYIMSIYFFSEIKLSLLLEKYTMFAHFPLSKRFEKIVVDFCGLIFYCLFGIIGLICKYALTDGFLFELLKSILFFIYCYFISLCFMTNNSILHNFKKFKVISFYSIICLIVMILFIKLSIYLIMILFCGTLPIIYYKFYREEEII